MEARGLTPQSRRTEKVWVGESSLSPKPVSPTVGDIEVEQYGDAGFALKIVGGEGRCTVIMRMTKENCIEMIKKFVEVFRVDRLNEL